MELLKLLSETPGVAGVEERVQLLVKGELEKICDEVRIDVLGNVMGTIKAKASDRKATPIKVMIAAHMDEIGFMVRHIDRDGFVRFLPVGGFDPRTLIAQRVIIHGKEDIKGVIAPQPGWLLSDEDKKKVLEIKELFIDTGRSKEDLEKFVQVGDVISLAQTFEELNDEVVVGRNFDDRIGVYVLIEALRRVRNNAVDIYAVATTQEELGVRGAPVAAYAIEPDIGIAIDGSLASDVPYAKEEEKNCRVGKGTGIYIIDNRTVSDSRLVNFLIKLAESNGIRYQRNLGGGTDASVIQRNKTGARVCTIGAPTRYMHSTSQLCHKQDIEETVKLLTVFLENAHRGNLV